ncbi:MAG: ABC transporter permease [Holophagaceae bacterium]|nr:ABC transporter permease [Holophagaceae bacterium]
MLKKIILHEMLLNLVSFRFLLIVSLFVVMCFSGLIVSIDSYNVAQKEYTEIAAVPENIGSHSMAIPPNPLGAFAEGTDKSSAVEVVTDILLYDFMVKVLGESDVSLRLSAFDALDMNFVVKVILSLGAILITFASVSGERFHGTLKLASASGASRKNLILGKLIASFICLSVPLIICTIISCLILALNDMLSTSMDIVRVCLFMLFSMVYILFFLLVGLVISISTKRPQESLITGVLCWLVLVFILPAVIPQLSKAFVRLPSARAMEQARAFKFYAAIFERDNSLNPPRSRDVLMQLNDGFDAVWEENRNQLANQARINRWLAMLSPSDIYNNASVEIVGNGVQNAIHAKKSIVQHIDNLAKDRYKPRDQRTLPSFTFNRMGFAADSKAALASIFFLCLETIVLLLFAYRKFMSLDLREG